MYASSKLPPENSDSTGLVSARAVFPSGISLSFASPSTCFFHVDERKSPVTTRARPARRTARTLREGGCHSTACEIATLSGRARTRRRPLGFGNPGAHRTAEACACALSPRAAGPLRPDAPYYSTTERVAPRDAGRKPTAARSTALVAARRTEETGACSLLFARLGSQYYQASAAPPMHALAPRFRTPHF